MKRKKVISAVVLSSVIAGLAISAANADLELDDITFEKTQFSQNFKKGVDGTMKGLTTEEKEALESMTDDEKKAFFEEKRAEREAQKEAKQAERDAYETVIDKLLAGEELTDEEEELRTLIIEKRAERKAKQAEMQAEREEIKAIMDKQKEGEELTDEEEAKLEEIKGNFRGKMGGFRK